MQLLRDYFLQDWLYSLNIRDLEYSVINRGKYSSIYRLMSWPTANGCPDQLITKRNATR
ncbi:hypothetical protein KDAU_69060 [Dictyobacter aurantiacus]|uniref:Uncharacterized protein n=1 Tax=Dictyobacter aurantiacus TaxID=1936993 RepID=A0A401ZRR9_9CHLR|nr:hypothetical protein KDAU_69060 [Dictyobacter aurantiacus]